MTMVFPDRAPKRLAVARKAGNTRDLARRVEEARTQGIEDEPVVASEKILALAGALNAHDRLTRGHGERVRAFTDLIADELDLPTETGTACVGRPFSTTSASWPFTRHPEQAGQA
jgi:HD-GYP domain-containing protein (c-di-GMP phosphodiesterase class II)